MPQKISARPHHLASLYLIGLGMLALSTGGCEDKALGRPCDLSVQAGQAQGAYNLSAPDCPSRLCIKPVPQSDVVASLDTDPYCTIQCASDNDCNGQIRDTSDPLDKRCAKGYTCGIPFGEGAACCLKLCVCRDFIGAEGLVTPDVCLTSSSTSCQKTAS
jgi:hypothetical protein